jgi:hypothetical protein
MWQHPVTVLFSTRPNGCVQEIPQGLLVQDDRQKGFVDFDLAVVFDEAQPPEFGHEQIYPGAGGADHFRQRFLGYLLQYSLGLLPSIASKQEKGAGQSLLGRVEELIDQVGLNSNVPCQHVGDETVGQGMLRVEHARHFFVSNDKDRRRRDGGRRSHAYRLACQASFSEKVTGAENRHHRFLAALINYGELDAPF